MKRLIFLFALAGTASAVNMWTPVLPPNRHSPAGYGPCLATAASFATPIHVTVADIAACGVVNNSFIKTQGFHGNKGANTHMANASDFDGLAYMVKNVTGSSGAQSFDLYKADGTTPVVGTGAWTAGGMIGRVQARTMNGLPTVMFDSTVATLLQQTSAGGYADSGRAEYTNMQNVITTGGCPTSSTVVHADVTGGCQQAYAFGWYAEGKPSSSTNKTRLINYLVNSHPVPTAACDPASTLDCFSGGIVASSYGDYAYEVYGLYYAIALNLGYVTLSSGQKISLNNYYLNDYPWTLGGHDYTGTTYAFPAPKTTHGGLTYTANPGPTTAILGVGTQFTTDFVPGDLILFDGGAYGIWSQIASITDDTHLTLALPLGTDRGNQTNHFYKAASPWADDGTQVGWLAWSKTNTYTLLCGGSVPFAPGCGNYPGGQSGGAGPIDPANNHGEGRLITQMLTLMTLAATGDDPRARWAAEDSLFMFYHRIWPWFYNMGGMSADQQNYHTIRLIPQVVMGAATLRKTFTDGMDIVSNDSTETAAWYDEMTKFYLIDRVNPASGTQTSHQYQGLTGGGVGWDQVGYWALMMSYFNPTGSWSAQIKYYATTTLSTVYSTAAYLFNRPDVTAVQSSNTSLSTAAALSPYCAAQWGSGYSFCGTDRRFYFASRSGTSDSNAWNGGGANILYPMWSTRYRDHGGQLHEVGPKVVINKLFMIDGDSAAGDGMFSNLTRGNIFVVGSTSDILGATDGAGTTNQGRSQFLYMYNSTKVAAEGVDITDHYSPAVNISQISRGVMHIKPAGSLGYLFMRDDYSATVSKTASTQTNYHISTCGGSPSGVTSPCTMALNRAAGTVAFTKSTSARVNTIFYGGTVNTENSSNTDGSYTGQAGFAFRVTNSTTGNSGSLFSVHQMFNDAGAAPPTFVPQDISGFKVIEVQHASVPAVAVIAPNASLAATSVPSFTTTHSGTATYAVTGLAAGVYSFVRGATPVCVGVTVNALENTLQCDSTAGTITISQVVPSVGRKVYGGKIKVGGKGK